MIKISILIRSIQSRSEQLSYLVSKLLKQCGEIVGIKSKIIKGCSVVILTFIECEIIFAVDSKEITSGEKANILLHEASGEWICYIDDDNGIADYFVEEILKATISNADTFAINGTITTNGAELMQWYLSKDFENITVKEKGYSFYQRKTNHLSPVKRVLALQAGFPLKSNAEDKAYSDALNHFLKTEFIINPPMYFYKYISTNKEY